MKSRNSHSLIGWILFGIAIILLLIQSAISSIAPKWLGNFILNTATALLAIAIMEMIFKTFLQKDLIQDVVTSFKRAIQLPIKAAYLRRVDIPNEQDPIEIIKSTQTRIYIKAISFAELVARGFIQELRDVLKEKNKININFMILSPDYYDMDSIASLTGLSNSVLIENINEFITQLKSIKSDYESKINYVTYSIFPTVGYWLVDPQKAEGWCRIEIYLYHKETQSSRINLVITKQDDPIFFEHLSDAILLEWENNRKQDKRNEALEISSQEDTKTTILNKKNEEACVQLVETNQESKFWPSHLSCLLYLTIPTTNLTILREFYNTHDPLVNNGIRGADKIPPRTPNGIVRLIMPTMPENKIDIILPRPTGIIYDKINNRFIVACQGDNTIKEINKNGIHQLLTNHMFNHLHSIDYYNGLLAVTCSGTDTILVFNIETKDVIFTWTAIENGYTKCPNGEDRKLNKDIDHRSCSYPTLEQTTHVNSVVFSRENPSILYASLFHQGEIIKINMKNSKTKVVLSLLDHPHGLKPDKNGGYIATQASHGRFHIFNSRFEPENQFADRRVEWFQDACAITRDNYVYTDVYNAKLKMINISSKSIQGEYNYEQNLKVYQIRHIEGEDIDSFSWLKEINS